MIIDNLVFSLHWHCISSQASAQQFVPIPHQQWPQYSLLTTQPDRGTPPRICKPPKSSSRQQLSGEIKFLGMMIKIYHKRLMCLGGFFQRVKTEKRIWMDFCDLGLLLFWVLSKYKAVYFITQPFFKFHYWQNFQGQQVKNFVLNIRKFITFDPLKDGKPSYYNYICVKC